MQILIRWVCESLLLLIFCLSYATYLFFSCLFGLLSLPARGWRVAGTTTTHATNAAIFIFRTSSMRSPNDWGNFIKRIFCSATCYAHIRSGSYVVCKQLEQRTPVGGKTFESLHWILSWANLFWQLFCALRDLRFKKLISLLREAVKERIGFMREEMKLGGPKMIDYRPFHIK